MAVSPTSIPRSSVQILTYTFLEPRNRAVPLRRNGQYILGEFRLWPPACRHYQNVPLSGKNRDNVSTFEAPSWWIPLSVLDQSHVIVEPENIVRNKLAALGYEKTCRYGSWRRTVCESYSYQPGAPQCHAFIRSFQIWRQYTGWLRTRSSEYPLKRSFRPGSERNSSPGLAKSNSIGLCA